MPTLVARQQRARTSRAFTKPADAAAAQIRFGIELETKVPIASHLAVGPYHRGESVRTAINTHGAQTIAPTFDGAAWRAERDASITINPGEKACEFVSPILFGAEGVDALCRFMAWMREIGATVNDSCGCHITVGVESIIGTRDPGKVSAFVRKLAHIAQWHAMSLYGQTGKGRHLNRYSHTLSAEVDQHMRRIVTTSSLQDKAAAAAQCGRGMLNLGKVFTHGVVEFRVFAGTTNTNKVLHHLATVLGLCRRASQVQCLGGFKKNRAQAQRTETAIKALRFLWDYLGWTGSARPVALGLFGKLHTEFPTYCAEAVRLCANFDVRFPDARL